MLHNVRQMEYTMPVMAKDERIAVRLSAVTKDRLTKAATADKRTLSSLLEKIIDDWLRTAAPARSRTRERTHA